MSRFTIATRKGGKTAMRVIDKKNLLAFFDFQDNDTGLMYRDFKLMNGKNGPWVGSPTGEPYEDKNGDTKYPEYVSAIYDPDEKNSRNPAGDEFFKGVAEVALEEYEKLSDGSTDDDEDAPRKPKKKKSGTGPVRSAPRSRTEDEEEDELPF
jgi:hypothetical protein